jgi:hypothetical protein
MLNIVKINMVVVALTDSRQGISQHSNHVGTWNVAWTVRAMPGDQASGVGRL